MYIWNFFLSKGLNEEWELWLSYLSKGQGLTRDTLDEVTDADDLWLQSLEMKNPDKNPRTSPARPVTTAIVTA